VLTRQLSWDIQWDVIADNLFDPATDPVTQESDLDFGLPYFNRLNFGRNTINYKRKADDMTASQKGHASPARKIAKHL
jgi:hypothetical protein